MLVHDGKEMSELAPYGCLAARRIEAVILEAKDIKYLLEHNHNNELELWLSDLLLRFPPKVRCSLKDNCTIGMDFGNIEPTDGEHF